MKLIIFTDHRTNLTRYCIAHKGKFTRFAGIKLTYWFFQNDVTNEIFDGFSDSVLYELNEIKLKSIDDLIELFPEEFL